MIVPVLRFRCSPSTSRLLGALTGGLLGGALLLVGAPALAASPLLDSIKQNPQQARNLCMALRQLNSQGQAALSEQGIALVASRQSLSPLDAEIVTTYVVGLYCPDVR